MRRVRWSSVLVLMGAIGCGADEPTGGGELPGGPGGAPSSINPAVTPGGSSGGAAGGSQVGGLQGGAAVGGSASGTFAGGQVGGSPAGGAISVTTLPEMGPCEQKVAQAGPVVPDIMIVLDRSQSMAPALPAGTVCLNADLLADSLACLWDAAACNRLSCAGVDCNAPPYMGTVVCGGSEPSPAVDRWAPAVQGVKSLTQEFQDKISFGLTVFPGDAAAGGGGGRNGGFCAPGNERVPVGLNTAAAIAQTLDGTQPTGATPTAATLQAVLNQITQKMADPDSRLPPQYVLLVTDGQPTCPAANGSTFNAQALAEDHAATLAAIDGLREAGAKTYVLGYDATVDPALAQKLTEFAMHGGTEDFHPVKDAPSIVEQFTKITASVASCSYQLDKTPANPTYVLVKLDDAKLELNTADGWVIDGPNVTIQGAACTTLKNGAPHRLVVTVECEPQAPPI